MLKSNGNAVVKPKHTGGKKIKMAFVIILAAIIVFMLIGTILHATYFKSKMEEIEPYLVREMALPGS